MIDDLSADGTTHEIDFGFGDADYKRHFGDGFVEEQDVGVFEHRVGTIGLNAVHSAVGGATAAGRAFAGATGALANLRRRRRLGGSTSLLRSFFALLLITPAAYVGAGLVAGPRAAMGPDKTVSSELFVDGMRRPDAVKPKRGPDLALHEPEGTGRGESEPILRAAA